MAHLGSSDVGNCDVSNCDGIGDGRPESNNTPALLPAMTGLFSDISVPPSTTRTETLGKAAGSSKANPEQERFRAILEAQRLELQRQQQQQQSQHPHQHASPCPITPAIQSSSSGQDERAKDIATPNNNDIRSAGVHDGLRESRSNPSTLGWFYGTTSAQATRSVSNDESFRNNATRDVLPECTPLLRTWNAGCAGNSHDFGDESNVNHLHPQQQYSNSGSRSDVESRTLNNSLMAQEQQTINDMNIIRNISSPPVAPAVVMDSSDNRASSSSYSYPVASFVTSLVRSSLDTIQNTVSSLDRPLSGNIPDTIPLFIRTETFVEPPQQHQLQGRSHHQQYEQRQQEHSHHQHHHFVGGFHNTNLPEFEQETEYIVVDGNIYEQPMSTLNEIHEHQTMIEDRVREQQRIDESIDLTRACQPKKVKRGMRRAIVKFFKRAGGRSNNSSNNNNISNRGDVNIYITEGTDTCAANLSVPSPTNKANANSGGSGPSRRSSGNSNNIHSINSSTSEIGTPRLSLASIDFPHRQLQESLTLHESRRQQQQQVQQQLHSELRTDSSGYLTVPQPHSTLNRHPHLLSQQPLPHQHMDRSSNVASLNNSETIPCHQQQQRQNVQPTEKNSCLKPALPHQDQQQTVSTKSRSRKSRGRWSGDSRGSNGTKERKDFCDSDSSRKSDGTYKTDSGSRIIRNRWVGRRNDKRASVNPSVPSVADRNNNPNNSFDINQEYHQIESLHPVMTGLRASVSSGANSQSPVISDWTVPTSTLSSPAVSGASFDHSHILQSMGTQEGGHHHLNNTSGGAGIGGLDIIYGFGNNPQFHYSNHSHHQHHPPVMPTTTLISTEPRIDSVTASFVGTCDTSGLAASLNGLVPDHQFRAPGLSSNESVGAGTTTVLGPAVRVEGFSNNDNYELALRKKEDECSENYNQALASIQIPSDESLEKSCKSDAPNVEDMLRRAVMETTTDLEMSQDHNVNVLEYLPLQQPSATLALASGMDPPPIPGRSPLQYMSSSSSCLKSDVSSVPLSKACANDEIVHNDILKVFMVSAPTVDKSWLARALAPLKSRKGKRERLNLGLVIHEWKLKSNSKSTSSTLSSPVPVNGGNSNEILGDESVHEVPSREIKCVIWDLQGASVKPDDGKANFGVHSATQALFFSSQALYLLVWDLACNNPKTFCNVEDMKNPVSFSNTKSAGFEDDDESDYDDDDEDDEFQKEEALKKADRALHADISHRVLSWVDCIAMKGPMSAILPVALIPDGMDAKEVKRRCNMLQNMLEIHIQKGNCGNYPQPILLTTVTESILCVNYKNGSLNNNEPIEGIEQLQELVTGIAADTSHSVFNHVGTPVPHGTVLVWDCIQRFKKEHKLILLDHLLYGIGSLLEHEYVVAALQFLSSIGQILYFGTSSDDILSRYIILSPKWLVSALSCILRNDFKREIEEARAFMNMQCLYFKDKYVKNELVKALVNSQSNIPLISDDDAKALWQSITFMREAADRCAQSVENATSAPTMFDFLEKLLVHSRVFLPIDASTPEDINEEKPSRVFFVPSLLSQADLTEIWTYKSSGAWKTTLCHSWLFRDGAPADLLDNLVVGLIRDLYKFKNQVPSTPSGEQLRHTRTNPVTRRSFENIREVQHFDQIGQVRIHQLMCWESSMLIKIGTVFFDPEKRQLLESFVEIFVAVCDLSSSLCVASDIMRPNMQRVIVSGKGEAGHNGRKIWKGGYAVVLDSIRMSLSNHANVDAQVICRDCLAHSAPRSAAIFAWDSVCAAANTSRGSGDIFCQVGHRVPSNELCGLHLEPTIMDDPLPQSGLAKPVSELLPSTVLVVLIDPDTKRGFSFGSGFIVDKKLGLIVTAAHNLFQMDKGKNYGTKFFGIKGARIAIGVYPEVMDEHTNKNAVFRYWADLVVDGIAASVDACVVRICSKIKRDVDDDVSGCLAKDEQPIQTEQAMLEEKLRPLKPTEEFEREESVRILGFNQGGKDSHNLTNQVNRIPDCVKGGVICMKFKISQEAKDTHSIEELYPTEEIVVNNCVTIGGHSGGPCVNNAGLVLGILSRSDPVDPSRCYLVPSSKLKSLIRSAKKQVSNCLCVDKILPHMSSNVGTTNPYYQNAMMPNP